MKKMILTSAAIIAFGASAVQAQMEQDDPPQSEDMSTEDMAMQDGMDLKMTPEQTATYNAMSAADRATYDGFDRTQQRLYFALNEQQRGQLMKLDPTTRAAAWKQIYAAAGVKEGEMNATGAATGTASTGAMAGSSTPGTTSTGNMQRSATSGPATAPPASASTKDYPTCSRTVTDNCVNPGRK